MNLTRGIAFRTWVAAVALCLVPALAPAQPPAGSGGPSNEAMRQGSPPRPRPDHPATQREQQQRQDQLRLMTRECDQSLEQVRQMNRWMEQKGTHESLRDLGRSLERSMDQVREMTHAMDGMCQDPAFLRDRDRLREMDKLRDQLRQVLRTQDRARLVLRRLVRMP
jgi:hypothetical protein